MTLNICSDLHWYDKELKFTYQGDCINVNDHCEDIDFSKFVKADVFVCAGDLANCNTDTNTAIEKIKKLNLYKQIVFCKGNHDFWNYDNDNEYHDYFYHNVNEFVFENVCYRFICCTMWSPIDFSKKEIIENTVWDYKNIKDLIIYQNDIFKRSTEWLKYHVNNCYYTNKVPIIVTHHVPRNSLIMDERYLQHDCISAFCVMNTLCCDIKPKLWIFGHDHTSQTVDIQLDETRYVKNCLRDFDMKIYPNGYNYIIKI